MDVPFFLVSWLLSGDDSDAFLEEIMELPPCPVCKDGRLLPFSDEKTPFAFWICSLPSCAYTLGRNLTATTYYKGSAALHEKEKGDKKWIECEF